ncbi:MAG: glutaredoxin family protein [Candidatus Fermentibacteraceae bacterium]|nr:glutaredoxin family protein [Candidatus Fermentibacteraceae bacterium]MBN2607494.1 glutaredoxin family protein [Candidatus Fermentibacteraceae bacterium]
MELINVEGADRGRVILFALSTCAWCRKTRRLLDSLGVSYSYIYVDRLNGEDRREAVAEMRRHNPAGNFPTVVIDNDTVITGHSPERLREALGVDA